MDKKGVSFLSPGMEYRDENLFIRAFGSTDLGVSLYLEAGGFKLFHAGDLNNWHWSDESTSEEIEQAQSAFLGILGELKAFAPTLDAAFFPVDPRMGTDYDRGARQFLESIRLPDVHPHAFPGGLLRPRGLRPLRRQHAQSYMLITHRGQTAQI